ncbi:DNA ligase 1-like [Mytilus trossulus]|uniref:DNA ligase 1-like n=1 Tax=Mytilus trossulus TaxID=6551 RepID=UPI003005B61E
MMQTDEMNQLIEGQKDQRENTLLCSFCLRIFDNFNDLQDHLILHDPLNLSNGQCEDYGSLDCVSENINFDSRNSMNTGASKLIKTKQNYVGTQQQLSPAIHSLLQLKNVMFKRKRDNHDNEEDDDEEMYNEEEVDEEDEDADEELVIETEEDDEEDDDSDDDMEGNDDEDGNADSDDYQDEDEDDGEEEEVERLYDEKDDEWNEQRKAVKLERDKMGVKKEDKKTCTDVKIKEINHVAQTESVRYKLLMHSDIVRRLETMVKTMKKSPRTHENNKELHRKPENKMDSPRTHKHKTRLFALDGKMTIHKSTQTDPQTESINEDQGCCQCKTCTCKCHAHLQNDMQNALKCSKQMFQSNIFPKEKDKKKLLTKTLTIQTVNKWFINYRYHFFLHIKKIAVDTISSKSTTIEINRLTNKHYTQCFQCVSKKPKHHSKQQVKRAFMAWRFALQNNLNPEKYMRQALKS